MSFPVSDWQFWVVSAIALVAAFVVIRTLVPRRKKRAKRATLTVEGRPVAGDKRD